MHSDIGQPFFSGFDVNDDLKWQMSRAEKYCLIEILKNLRPQVSIEIGTYKGGSLQVLSTFSEKVYSVDISTSPRELLAEKFSNVEFLVGDSYKILPQLCRDIEERGEKLGFVLIDGDHSTKAVRRDLQAVLDHPHKNPVTILLHDSFNPQSRKGIRSIDYRKYPNVKYAELDYIGGSFWHNKTYREMWGGFAMISIDPGHQQGTTLCASLDRMYKRIYWASIHVIKDRFQFLVPLKRKYFP